MNMEGVAGSNAIDSRAVGVTVMLALAVLPPKVAVMTDVPMATPLATPVVLLTVATVTVPDDQTDVGETLTDAPSA